MNPWKIRRAGILMIPTLALGQATTNPPVPKPVQADVQLVNLRDSADDEVSNVAALIVDATRKSPAETTAAPDNINKATKYIVELRNESLRDETRAMLASNNIRIEKDSAGSLSRFEVSVPPASLTNPQLVNLVNRSGFVRVGLNVPASPRRGLEAGQLVDADLPTNLNSQILSQQLGPSSIQGPVVSSPECAQYSRGLALTQDLPQIVIQPPTLETASDLVRFVISCFAPVVQLTDQPPPPLPDFVASPGALRVVGVLFIDDGSGSEPTPFCTGFQIDAKRIATARHCFFDPNVAESTVLKTYYPLATGQVFFQRLVAPYEAVKVRDIAPLVSGFDPLRGGDPSQPIRPSADIIVLRLAKEIPGTPEIRLATALNARHAAWIAGPVDLVEVDGNTAATIPKSVRSVRWTNGSECAAYPQKNHCLAHACQAVEGFSGAPIIVKSADPSKIVVGGIHLGTYESLGDSCPSIGSAALINGTYTANRGSNGGIDATPLSEYIAALENKE